LCHRAQDLRPLDQALQIAMAALLHVQLLAGVRAVRLRAADCRLVWRSSLCTESCCADCMLTTLLLCAHTS
jgi:hypothetical protein